MSNLLSNLPASILAALVFAWEKSLEGARSRRTGTRSESSLFSMPISVAVEGTGEVFGLQPELESVNQQAYAESVQQYETIKAFFRQQLTAYRDAIGAKGDIVFAGNANLEVVDSSYFHGQPIVLVNVYSAPRTLTPKERFEAAKARRATGSSTILPRAGSILPTTPVPATAAAPAMTWRNLPTDGSPATDGQ